MFVDSHAHIDGPEFDADRDEIIERAHAAGVSAILNVGTGDPHSDAFERAIALGKARETVYTAIGTHPHDARFLYTRDQGGNELNHLYVRQKDGSEFDLTPGEKLKAQFAGWSGDRKAFFVFTNEREPKFFDVYRYDTGSYDREMIYRNGGGYDVEGVSPAGKWIALSKPVGTATNELVIHSVDKKETKQISTGEAQYDHYVERHRRLHPEAPVLSRREFERRRIDRMDARPGNRCC